MMQSNDLDSCIGKKIRDVRKNAGLTQMQLAKFLNISHQLMQKYETGKVRIYAKLLFDLSQLLSIDPGYFYNGYQKIVKKGNNVLPGKEDVITQEKKQCWHILLMDYQPEYALMVKQACDLLDKKIHLSCEAEHSKALALLKQAIDQDQQKLPDFILLEIGHSYPDAIEFIDEVKRNRHLRFIPIIIVTHSVNAAWMLRCYHAHVAGYVCKSPDKNIFIERMSDLLNYWMQTVVTPLNY